MCQEIVPQTFRAVSNNLVPSSCIAFILMGVIDKEYIVSQVLIMGFEKRKSFKLTISGPQVNMKSRYEHSKNRAKAYTNSLR